MFEVARFDPRTKDLKIKESEWALVRRSNNAVTVFDYVEMNFLGQSWAVVRGMIINNKQVNAESPLFARTARYHRTRIGINKVRAEAQLSWAKIDLNSL